MSVKYPSLFLVVFCFVWLLTSFHYVLESLNQKRQKLTLSKYTRRPQYVELFFLVYII